MKNRKNLIYAGLPVIGVLFYIFYINIASIDIVYSDYIRLINSYLPDVFDPSKFFVADLLTRIPVNYLERAVNVIFFEYSVTFDRVIGILCFGLSAFVIAKYSSDHDVSIGWYAVLMVIMFSLNKWEMIYNGTGWAHFLAFACFYYNYCVLDAVCSGRTEFRKGFIKLLILPTLITIFIAGPYCAIYTVTLVIAYMFIRLRGIWFRKRDPAAKEVFNAKQTAALIVAAVIPLLIYMWSNSQAVYEYSGAVDTPLFTAFFDDPLFFVKFFLKSFASTVFGVEFIDRYLSAVPGSVWCLLGALVLAVYFLALWMNFYYHISDNTLVPLMLLASGGMNHLLVLVSRYIFMPNDLYGMSSRYALQYLPGILGILLTFALVWKKTGTDKRPAWIRPVAVAVAAVFLFGNVITTGEELTYARNRKYHNENDVMPVVLNFENESDEALEEALEYRHPGIREALTILKENGWNIFGKDS